MHTNPEVDLQHAARVHLTDGERRRLAESLAQGICDRPASIIGKARQTMRELFVGIPLIHQVVPLGPAAKAQVKRTLWWRPGAREIADENVRDFADLERSGRLITARVNGEVAGAAAYRFQRNHPVDGRPIVELCRVTVLPEFRGLKLSGALMDAALAAAKEEFPDACVVYSTREEKVRSWGRRQGFQAFTFDELADFWEMNHSEEEKNKLQKWLDQGWATYVQKRG